MKKLLLKEILLLLEDLEKAEAFAKKMFPVFKKTAEDVSDDIVKSTLKKFYHIKTERLSVARNIIRGLNVPRGGRFDINNYKNFDQLLMFVDYVSGQTNVGEVKFDDIKVDGKPIAHNHGLEIYVANSKHACITYKGDKPYSWCVSRSDASNMYYTYRYKNYEPTFYFVKDIAEMEREFSKPISGEFEYPYHFFVIQVTKNGEFIVTSANNDGDEEMTWEEILKLKPALKYFKDIFVHVPLSDKDKELKRQFSVNISDEEFKNFKYDKKEAYLDIAIPTFKLTDAKFESLPRDLKNKYIGYGLGLTDKMYDMIKGDKELMKRFSQITVRRANAMFDNKVDIDLTKKEYEVLISSDDGKKVLEKATPVFLVDGMKQGISFTEFDKKLGSELLNKIVLKTRYEGHDPHYDDGRFPMLMKYMKTEEDIKLLARFIRMYAPKQASVGKLFSSAFDDDEKTTSDNDYNKERDTQEPWSALSKKMENIYERLVNSVDITKNVNGGKLTMEDAAAVLFNAQRYLKTEQIEKFKKYLIEMVKNGNIKEIEDYLDDDGKYISVKPTQNTAIYQFINKFIAKTMDINGAIENFGEETVKKALIEGRPTSFGEMIEFYTSPKRKSGEEVLNALYQMRKLVGSDVLNKKVTQGSIAYLLRHYTRPNNFDLIYDIFGEARIKIVAEKMDDASKLQMLENMNVSKESFFNTMILLRSKNERGELEIVNNEYSTAWSIDKLLEFIRTVAKQYNISFVQMLDFFGKSIIRILNRFHYSGRKILGNTEQSEKETENLSEYIYSVLSSDKENRDIDIILLAWIIATHPDPLKIINENIKNISPKYLITSVLDAAKESKNAAMESIVRKKILKVLPYLKSKIQRMPSDDLSATLSLLTKEEDYPIFKYIVQLKLPTVQGNGDYDQFSIISTIQTSIKFFPKNFMVDIFPILKEKLHLLSTWALDDLVKHIASHISQFPELAKAIDDVRAERKAKLSGDITEIMQERHMIYRNYFI